METLTSTKGMIVAPHSAAAEAGAEILAAGGTAIDAMIAAAATCAVAYPHMNALGGDGFWLIAEPDRAPRAILAAGPAGSGATIEAYRALGYDQMPTRGPGAAATVAGTVAGWALAHELAATLGGGLPLGDLLADAIRRAKEGVPVSASEARTPASTIAELADLPGFAESFLVDAKLPAAGAVRRHPRLADALEQLAHAGLDDFYRGDVGSSIAQDLERLGSPVKRADLLGYRARLAEPLSLSTRWGTVWNTPLPTQGVASLIILGLFERLGIARDDGFDFVHGLVEATKRAFRARDAVWADPDAVPHDPALLLAHAHLDRLAAAIDRGRSAPWSDPRGDGGDTVWLGAVDRNGLAVSFIQSIFFEYGSGCVLPETGILWLNRASSFSLDPAAVNRLGPGRLPPHTLNPPMARLADGRLVVYGTMGGEGQPQTQAAVFARHVVFGHDVAAAIEAPRWLIGRTWGESSASLKLESRFDPDLVQALERAGHPVEVLPEAYADAMGHAGMIVWRPNGGLEGAHDPRSDGGAAAG
jgi:gamma-glutamyltranspeptidase